MKQSEYKRYSMSSVLIYSYSAVGLSCIDLTF